jgi:transcriptional regulator with XRE-family HTH domain
MIGAKIKELRTNKGLTQEELSEKVGVNPKYLSSIERGKGNPTLNTLIKLSESLEVDIGDIFIFRFVEAEDPDRRRDLINSFLDEANSEQLKLILKVLSVIVR